MSDLAIRGLLPRGRSGIVKKKKRGAGLATTGEPVALGAFVIVATETERNLGIGKVVEMLGHRVTVAYFDVPGETQPFQIDASVTDVRVVALAEQTRVFRCNDDTGRWQVGRIEDGDGPTCLVAFPNQESATLPRAELQVRWRKPIANPTEFLIRQVTETPLFAAARSKFTRAVTAQHAACRGMGALLSSSLELEVYQFNVVRKVLQDPIQRYLLADEVGLGKTIEAGLLVRQYILDSADARVLLIVPRALVAQWRQELIQRFALLDWLDDYIWVVPNDDVVAVEEHLSGAGMLVVDEAHHLSRQTDGSAHSLYELLRRHVSRVPRLLLLSGTPVLADTSGFLRILHLLDPVVFPLDDLEGFRQRIQSRQLVAEIAASLQPDNVLSMEDDLDRLTEAFGDDPTLMKRVEALRPIVQALPDEDDEEFLAALGALRAHLSETYKLHRRVLRNRRKAVPWATPQRKGLETLPYTSNWRGERQRVLDELRVHLVNSGDAAATARNLFSCAVHPCGGRPIEKDLLALGIHDARALDLARQVDDLTTRSDEEGERQRVTREAVRRCLSTQAVQVVIFCDEASTADALTFSLRAELGQSSEVLRHNIADASLEDDRVEPWRRFLTDPERCRVLVCDFRAEEGLNLHGGHKVALHYDLPAAPNRIEQRLGRLDRYGVGNAVRSLAPVCESDPVEVAWAACLAEGLQVFSASMASLQYLAEDVLRNAIQDWCNEGVDALLHWKDQLAGPTGWAAKERRRIDQQDSLDAMGDPQNEEFDQLEEVDADWRSWRDAFDGFALGTLLFSSRDELWKGKLPEGERVFRLNYVRQKNHRTLMSLPEFVNQFLGTIDREARHSTARSPLTYPYAFNRHTVMSKEGQSRALRPLRYGDPLVESLRSFCHTDDRGRVFAMWRYRPKYEARDASGCDLWFRFDFVVGASLPDVDDDAARALTRRAEQHFPPQFHTVWVDATREVTMDPPAHLTEHYRKNEPGRGGDYNLNPRRWQILQMQDKVPWLLEWRRHCEAAAERALQFLATHEILRQHQQQGLASLRSQHATRVAQVESRLTRLTGVAQAAERRDLEEEEDLISRLTDAIRAPAIRTDVAGAIFASAVTPFVR
jgi:ATP-dependent helicase HepA